MLFQCDIIILIQNSINVIYPDIKYIRITVRIKEK